VRKAALIAVLALVAATGCGRRADRAVVARTGSSVLTAKEFYASIPEQLLAVMTLEDQEETLKNWGKTELFYQAGLSAGIGQNDDIRRRLKEIERELIAEEYIKRFMDDVPEITDEDARKYFEAHKADYAMQVRLAHILVRNRAEAERALAQIRAGTPFDTVARSVSIDQTASTGGDLGYMRRGEMIHELEEAAFSLAVGEVSDVIPSSYGYHIIRVLDRHPGAGQPTFESKYAAVMSFLTSQRRREAFDQRLADLDARAPVVVDTARLGVAARARMSEKNAPGLLETTEEEAPAESGKVKGP
jgi:peptidyl-prolyl cis-trans isomerase C